MWTVNSQNDHIPINIICSFFVFHTQQDSNPLPYIKFTHATKLI